MNNVNFGLFQKLVKCSDSKKGMFKAFLVKNVEGKFKLRIYHVTNKAQGSFQMPVEVEREDPLYPLTSFAKVDVKNKHFATIKSFLELVKL